VPSLANPTQDDEISDVSYDDEDVFSDTMSIDSEIRAHRYENGRRYNAFRAGEYWFVASHLVAVHADLSGGPTTMCRANIRTLRMCSDIY
jgi:hypothetical protein